MTGFTTFPALLPLLRQEWKLSASKAGLFSGVFFVGYMVAAPILVGLTDRLDTRHIYLMATLPVACGNFEFAALAEGPWSAMVFKRWWGHLSLPSALASASESAGYC